jgi:hypothetical protein
MKEKISYSQLALNAMCRASKEAQKKAAENNLKLPIWKNGNIVYIEPDEILTKTCTGQKKLG